MDSIERDIRKLKEQAAKIIAPGFSYVEQELIYRVLKSVLPQMKSRADINTAKEIIKRMEWLNAKK